MTFCVRVPVLSEQMHVTVAMMIPIMNTPPPVNDEGASSAYTTSAAGHDVLRQSHRLVRADARDVRDDDSDHEHAPP